MPQKQDLEKEIDYLRENGYRENSEKVVESAETSRENGLSQDEVESRLNIFGMNKISEKEVSAWSILFDKFKDPLILLLIGSAVISFLVGNIKDGVGISIAIVIVSTLGFFTEHKSEQSLQELKKLTSLEVKVLRNGNVKKVDSEELVPGDILILSQGDKVPADARIIESKDLRVDESILTGESETVSKNSEVLEGKLSIMDRKNSVFSGTIVASGSGKAVVLGTGENSEIGAITKITAEIEEKTPLEKELRDLGNKISRLAIGICITIFVVGAIRGFELFHLFAIAVSLAVAAIPEGLPITTTITLALGVKTMAEKMAIVRKLPSIETLGSVSKICSDKTGTLTENMMTVRKFTTFERDYDVTGMGSETKGDFQLEDGTKINPTEDEELSLALRIGVLCNDASLSVENESVSFVGDPTEGALLVAARKAGMDLKKLNEEYREVEKVPFSSEKKLMVSVREKDGEKTALCKGAPSKILDISTSVKTGENLTEEMKKTLLEKAENLASKGMRILALGKKEIKNNVNEEDLESGYEYVGLVAMIDPARKEVIDSVKKCKNAGIQVSMITGDNKNTAKAIADEVGILDDGRVITGTELEEMGEAELEDIIDEISVFARTTPKQKLKILRVLKDKGKITAMTGDGVNDVPALKKADIGIAMGMRGSDAAKEASDMILTDDKFETITEAINYGRSVYQNIKKFLSFQLTTSIGAILVVSAATFLGLDLPMTPVQILWINVIMDGPPAISLGLEPPEPDIMENPPRDPEESILSRKMMVWISMMAMVMGVGTLFVFTRSTGSPDLAKTLAFTTFAMFQAFNVINCRAFDKYFWKVRTKNKYLLMSVIGIILIQLAIVYIPPIQSVFETTALSLQNWLIILGTAAVIIPANVIVQPIVNKYFP